MMIGMNQDSNRSMGLFLVLLFGLGLPLLHFFTPLLSPLGFEATRIRDDAAYQFVVARNLAEGKGFVFDGEHLASGVQILWTLILGASAKVFGVSSLPILSMLLGVGLFLGSVVFAFRLLERNFGTRIALLLASLMASRGLVFAEAMNGQETSLALLVLFLFAYWAFPREGQVSPHGTRLRILVILLPWIRTDLLLFPLGLALWPRIAHYFGLPARETRQDWIDLGLSLGLYLLGNLLFFGILLPPSGFAVPWLFHANFLAGGPGIVDWIGQFWWFLRPLFIGAPFLIAGLLPAMAIGWWLLAPLARRQRGIPLFLVFLAFLFGASNLEGLLFGSLLLGLGLGPTRRQQFSFSGEGASASLLAFFGLAFLHLVLRWYPRDYYFVPLLLPGFLCLGLLLERWTSDEGLQAFIPRVLRDRIAYLVLLGLGLSGALPPGSRFPWQEEMRFAGRWLAQVFPSHPPLGSFNGGWIAWEYQGRVLNLDGCVDGAALPALKERRLIEWLKGLGVGLILDSWRQLGLRDPDPHSPHASGRYLGPRGFNELVPLISFDLPGVEGRHPGTGSLVLCMAEGEPLPPLPPAPLLLGKDSKGRPVLFAKRGPKGYQLEIEIEGDRKGRHKLSISSDASKAPYLLTRIPGTKGRIFFANGRTISFP